MSNHRVCSARLVSPPGLHSGSSAYPPLSTGVKCLDEMLGGGFPCGQISEITGSLSSGKTGLLFSVLGRVALQGTRVVYIDVFDALDPVLAESSGIDLQRLLWLRLRKWNSEERFVRALKALDILARSDGFGVIVLDWDPPRLTSWADDPARRVPFSVWFRVKRVLHGKKTAVFLLGRRPVAGSASAVVLEMGRHEIRWRLGPEKQNRDHRVRLLQGITSTVFLARGRGQGYVQVHSDFRP